MASAADRFVKRIRKPDKKAYAKAYLRWLRRGGAEPKEGNLSFMAAQGVRMQLDKLVGPKGGLGGARKKGTHSGATSTKGWSKSSPKTVTARRRLIARCGRGAFLLVGRTKTGKSDPEFPIVAARSTACAPDCRGLWAAKQRASQTGRKSLAKKATRIAKAVGCRWARNE